MSLPKGIRLNNPGNIEKGLNWKGLADVQADSRFATFESPEYGIRAIAKLLRTYNKKYGIDTIKDIITRWAPTHENPTASYISNVAKWTGFSATEHLNMQDPMILARIAKAICRQENGIVPWDDETFIKGAKLAFE